MQTLIIGDIHGCWDELEELLDRAGVGPSDRIVSVGDLVDRGPDPVGVCEFFRTTPGAAAVLGNHEKKHVGASEGRVRPALSQAITRRQAGDDRYAVMLDYFRTLPNHLAVGGVLVVHAFWEPGVPLDRQRDNVLNGTMSGEKFLQARLGDARPWYERYDGPAHLVVGHHQYREAAPLVHECGPVTVYGLDTGCATGGRLTGLLLPSHRLVSVPSRGNHWAAVRREWAPPPPSPRERAAALKLEHLDARVARSQGWMPRDPAQARQLAEQAAIVAAVAAAVEAIHSELVATVEAVRAELAGLPAEERDRHLARALAALPNAGFLHLARKGALTHRALQSSCKTVGELLAWARQVTGQDFWPDLAEPGLAEEEDEE